MKNLLIIAFILSLSFNGSAQKYDTTRVVLSRIEFEKLKSDFLKISETKLFKKTKKNKDSYFKNSPFVCFDIDNETLYKECLSKSLSKKSIRKAISLKKNYIKTQKEFWLKYPELLTLFNKTTIEQKAELRKIY
ncbi:MAG: hypothetical protein CFE23_16580 [Flavobacterium sp. BFFFF1]|uniref:hypothetical protein n=1 Tax=Flavobacterium sp. BFFFF1 TaxID=2015557 RepID=UPI000BC93C45|nr:hypothetical protein [Flavobacterium sp. BFFFF1]OYU78877.1 MAG: hypothetical protein CFE23_16580 [Flavobacterium sp. BFFFF1]